jgi:hypothetical protein
MSRYKNDARHGGVSASRVTAQESWVVWCGVVLGGIIQRDRQSQRKRVGSCGVVWCGVVQCGAVPASSAQRDYQSRGVVSCRAC